MRGDAVNVVDLVCDAVKDAIGLDDRWFSIKRLDWEIAKVNPQLIVGLAQPDQFDAQACSHCGRVRPFGDFHKHKGNKNGIGRVCSDCRRLRVAKPEDDA